MATKQKKKTKLKANKKKSNSFDFVSTTVRYDIIAIVLVVIAIIITAASFGFAGNLGSWVLSFFKLIFGLATYFLPPILVLIAIKIFKSSNDDHLPGAYIVGGLGFVLAIAALITAVSDFGSGYSRSRVVDYGGTAGWILSAGIGFLLDRIITIIVFMALSLVSIITLLDERFKTLSMPLLAIIRRDNKNIGSAIKKSKLEHKEKPQLKVNTPEFSNKLKVRGTISPTASPGDRPTVKKKVSENWEYPDFEFLEPTTTEADPGDVNKKAESIDQTFMDFGIDVSMQDVSVGPAVSQYSLKPPNGMKLGKISSLSDNLALSLAATSVRIEAPIPGKSLVGIEIPNDKPAMVRMQELVTSKAFMNEKSNLAFILGRDVSGDEVIVDLASMPHLLIAGATGSGKSVTVNTLIVSLLYRNTPEDLKLILVDPKRVEMMPYNSIPHLLTPVIVDPEKTIAALKWAVGEMEKRYKVLQNNGNRNIKEYNKTPAGKDDKMPFIVIIIDELADLMAVAAKEVEGLIVRLAQMARAVGIHLVFATQRPSVNVITGTIKANIPARIALSTASQIDSRTIIDQAGSEKLLGNGDMLVLTPQYQKPRRVQGVFISEEEVSKITSFLREQRAPEYNDEIVTKSGSGPGVNVAGVTGSGSQDELYDEIVEFVINSKKASSSHIMRNFTIGFSRASRMLDEMEKAGIVGPQVGTKVRDILVDSAMDVEADKILDEGYDDEEFEDDSESSYDDDFDEFV